MSAGPAAAPTTAAPVAAGVAQPQAVAVVDVARTVLAQARQVLLEAVVQGRSADGVVTLKTEQGNVQVRTTVPLPAGTQIALELARNGDQLTARLLPAAPQRLAPPPSTSTTGQSSAGNAPAPAPQASSATTATRGADAPPTPRGVEFGRATFAAVALSPPPQSPAPPAGSGASGPPRLAEAPPARGTSVPLAAGAPPRAPATLSPQPANAAAPTTSAPAPRGAPPAQAGMAAPAPVDTRTSAPVLPRSRPDPSAEATPNAPRAAAPATAPRAAPTATIAASAPPDPAIATRAASMYAQARATSPARDARALPGSASTAGSAGSRTAQASGAGSAPAAPAPTPPATKASQPRLQPGTTFEVRLAQPAAPPPTASAAARQAQPLPATVVGALPQGRLMVDTPIGRLAVAAPPDLLATPPGETLDLEWLPETSRAPLAGERRPPDAQSTRAWPQARDAAAALLAHADPTARAAAEQLVPKPGPRLAQQMMAFIGRGDGDLARWLGESVMRQIEQLGLAEILARGEAGATREPDRQAGNGDWRHVTVPLFDGQNLHPIEFRSRRRNGGGGEREGARDQSRFVVDCVHDELGPVQIDGLMTTGGARKRLDVILRSHGELPESDRLAIAALFADACGAMGFGGEIAFQVAEHFPVVADNPLAHRAVIA